MNQAQLPLDVVYNYHIDIGPNGVIDVSGTSTAFPALELLISDENGVLIHLRFTPPASYSPTDLISRGGNAVVFDSTYVPYV